MDREHFIERAVGRDKERERGRSACDSVSETSNMNELQHMQGQRSTCPHEHLATCGFLWASLH